MRLPGIHRDVHRPHGEDQRSTAEGGLRGHARARLQALFHQLSRVAKRSESRKTWQPAFLSRLPCRDAGKAVVSSKVGLHPAVRTAAHASRLTHAFTGPTASHVTGSAGVCAGVVSGLARHEPRVVTALLGAHHTGHRPSALLCGHALFAPQVRRPAVIACHRRGVTDGSHRSVLPRPRAQVPRVAARRTPSPGRGSARGHDARTTHPDSLARGHGGELRPGCSPRPRCHAVVAEACRLCRSHPSGRCASSRRGCAASPGSLAGSRRGPLLAQGGRAGPCQAAAA